MEEERQMLYLAEYDYSEAIMRDPTNTDYILNRANILITLGKKRRGPQGPGTTYQIRYSAR